MKMLHLFSSLEVDSPVEVISRRSALRVGVLSLGTVALASQLVACSQPEPNPPSHPGVASDHENVPSSETTPALSLDNRTAALIVMHYQTDVLKLLPAATAAMERTRTLCDAARANNVPVYFVQIHFSPGYPEVAESNKNGQGLKNLGLFVTDTIAPELDRRETEPLILARRVSAFYGTDLQIMLQNADVDTLILAGVASTGVVLSTIAHASDADYRIVTVEDCCFDPDQVAHDRLFATAFETRSEVADAARVSEAMSVS